MMCALHVKTERYSPLIGCDMGRAEREPRKTFKQDTNVIVEASNKVKACMPQTTWNKVNDADS